MTSFIIKNMKFLRVPETVLFILLIGNYQIEAVDSNANLQVSVNDLKIKVGHNSSFELIAKNVSLPNIKLSFWPQHKDIISLNPHEIVLHESDKTEKYKINITALSAGHSEINSNTTDNKTDLNDVFLRVTVFRVEAIDTISLVVGWIYFVAWSVSFYPQIYYNWRRKSVVGLNFDFQALNIMGFVLYSLFNIGLYAIPEIQSEYATRHPKGLNPVQVNDIVFAVHASAACLITIIQCFIYESAEQRVSITARGIMAVFLGVLVLTIILAASSVIHWLDFLYVCSYVKLSITLIKYVPQAYMNYRRKSTVGWSIGNIILDFTGGILSMLQMMLLAYNYDDWVTIFSDLTKFALGLFSVVFDIFFMIQHYFLYKDLTPEEMKTITQKSSSSNSTSSLPMLSKISVIAADSIDSKE